MFVIARGSLTALACIYLLSGCGGGGGGGGGGNNSGNGPQGSITLSTRTLNFASNDPAVTPASQTLSATINTTASGTVYLRIVATGPAVAAVNNIVITSATTGQATVVPADASALGPGVYNSTITVIACTSDTACSSGIIGTPQSVNVYYMITGVASSAKSVTYTLGLNSEAADYTQTIPVVANPSYTATSDANWLTLTPSSGSGGTTQLTANLTPSLVDPLESGDHSATITLMAPSGNTLKLPVTLTVTKPQLDQVTPYIAVSNKSGVVTLRGLYLDSLPPNSIDFSSTTTGAGISASGVTTISSTELRATYPAATAGSYFVRMHDSTGAIIDRSNARLVVIDPPNYPATTVSYPADARNRIILGAIYDAERKALLVAIEYANGGGNGTQVIDPSSTQLMRFQYASGWSSPTVVTYPYLDTLALSADGRGVIAASDTPVGGLYTNVALSVLSPTTLATGTTLPVDINSDQEDYFRGLAVTSTNDVLAMDSSRCCSGPGWPLLRYSIKNNLQSAMISPADGFTAQFTNGIVVASGDGQRVVVGGSPGSSEDQSLYEYSSSSSTNVLTKTPVYFDVYAMQMDQVGNNLLIYGNDTFHGTGPFVRIYDRNWNIRGSLPPTAANCVLAPDGSRAYSYDGSGKVHTYDLTASTVSGTFPEIGSGIVLPSAPVDAHLIITPDGHTLFLVDADQIVVQPLP